jgi:hypothetical protein
MSRVTERIFEYPKQVTKNGREMARKKSNFRVRTAGTVRNATALSRNADFDVICGTRIILKPLIAVGTARLQKRCNIRFRSYFSIVICVACLFLKLMIRRLPEKCPAIFGAYTNFFWGSRSTWLIYENQSSIFSVTGHSPLEWNEILQYVLSQH